MIGQQVDPLGRARREVLGLFADEGASQRATAWARGILAAEGIDPRAQQLQAIRALRRAERGLGLAAARYLLTLVNGGPEGGGRLDTRRRSPLLE